jgi:hypothetical protein
MFRTVPAAESTPVVESCAHPVPLGELERDLSGVPAEGWPAWLGRRGVAIIPDDLGRDSVSRGDARRLLDERRADQLRKQAVLKQQEQQAIAADMERRSQLWQGLSAEFMPPDVLPAAAMLQASRDAQPKRRSMVEDLLGRHDEMVFHPIVDGAEAS